MKNKKIYISMLVLTIVFLVAMYVLKFFFPQEFILAIENETIVKIGTFIDNRPWLYTICCVITSSITYYFYVCASSHRFKLKLWEVLVIVGTSLGIRLIGLYVDADIRTILSWTSFAFIPAIMGGDLKSMATVFTVHSLSQGLSIKIRNLPMYFTNMPNFVTTMFVGIECYLWLVLMFIIFNYKKENK